VSSQERRDRLQASALTRRQVVGAGAAGAGAVLLGGSPFVEAARRRDERRRVLARDARFDHGVSAGAPMLAGALLWTRLTGAERGGWVALEVASDPGFRKVVHRSRARAPASRDFAVKALVRSRRIRPGERYWYRFSTRDAQSPVGRFTTLRPPGSAEPVRIGFFSCQKWHQGYYTAHRGLAREDDLDLVISLGDYIYEEPAQTVLVPERKDRTGALRDGDVQSLAEYREKYRLYQSDPDLRAMHAKHPFMAIWDDHEAEDDYAGEHEGDPLRPRRVPFAERRRAGYRAFFESLPVLRRRDDPSRIYRSLRVGSVRLLMLDTRQYRDPLACEPVQPCPQGRAPGRSILGADQKTWLLGQLTAAREPWKVIANQVMMMGLEVPTGTPINADQWDGYAAERQEILEHVLADGVTDVTVLTGDIHTFFAGTVTTTGNVAGRPAATEFVGGSITSAGISEDLEKRGLPRSTEGGQEAGLRRMNPHLAYAQLSAKGYGVMEVRPDELRVTYRSPSTVLEPRAEIRDLANFRVARGSTQVEVL
jgi:alkaline phosphatase D